MIKIVALPYSLLHFFFANFFMQVLKYIITYISMYVLTLLLYSTTYVKSRINNGSGPQEGIKISGGVVCNKGA